MSENITVYSKPNCGDCAKTKALLDELGVSYDVVDISKDRAALLKIKAMGFRAAPVVDAGDRGSWDGYKEDKVRALAGSAAPSAAEQAADDDAWDF